MIEITKIKFGLVLINAGCLGGIITLAFLPRFAGSFLILASVAVMSVIVRLILDIKRRDE